MQHYANGALTGYGYTYNMRSEFADFANVADTEKIGGIDAPSRIAAGGMAYLEAGEYAPAAIIQHTVWRI